MGWLNQYREGGMIKRADGSYSQRGLWDNIRDNAGSGKKPTKQMLQQEKKIKAAEHKQLGGYSTTGYKADSPDRNKPYNLIPTGRITMQNVPHPVYGIDNYGNHQIMMPGKEYQFPGQQVFETPVEMQGGGKAPIYTDNPNDPRLRAYSDSSKIYKLSQKVQHMGNSNEHYPNFFIDNNQMNKLANKTHESPIGLYTNRNVFQYAKPVQPIEYRRPQVQLQQIPTQQQLPQLPVTVPAFELPQVIQEVNNPMADQMQASPWLNTVGKSRDWYTDGTHGSLYGNGYQMGGGTTHPNYSVVDYLASQGEDFSKTHRADLAKQYGVTDYDFSAAKNIELLNRLRNQNQHTTSVIPQTIARSIAVNQPSFNFTNGYNAKTNSQVNTPAPFLGIPNVVDVNAQLTNAIQNYGTKKVPKNSKVNTVPMYNQQNAQYSWAPVSNNSASNIIVKEVHHSDIPALINNLQSKGIMTPVDAKKAIQKVAAPAFTSGNNPAPIPQTSFNAPFQRPADSNKQPIQINKTKPEDIYAKPISGIESGYIVDKEKNMGYIVKDHKVLHSFPVLTGAGSWLDKEQTLTDAEYEDVNHTLGANKKVTPSGVFHLKPHEKEMYGYKHFDIVDPATGEELSIANHLTYAPSQRGKAYFETDPRKRDLSFGCVNCQKPSIDKLWEAFPEGADMHILPRNENKSLSDYYKIPSEKYGGWLQQYQQGGFTPSQSAALRQAQTSAPVSPYQDMDPAMLQGYQQMQHNMQLLSTPQGRMQLQKEASDKKYATKKKQEIAKDKQTAKDLQESYARDRFNADPSVVNPAYWQTDPQTGRTPQQRLDDMGTDLQTRVLRGGTDVIDNLNPGVWVAGMAGNLAKAPLKAQQENSYMPYVSAIGEPLAFGIGEGLAAPYIDKFNKIVEKKITDKAVDVGTEIKSAINNFNKAKNVYNAYKAPVPITPQESALLKNTRVIGSIFNSGADESSKLKSILNKVDNLPDTHLKAATGFTKAEIQNRIKQLEEGTVVKKQESINSQIPEHTYTNQPSLTEEDIASMTRQINERRATMNLNYQNNIQDIIDRNIRTTGYNSFHLPPPEEFHLDINTNFVNQPIKKTLADKVYDKWLEKTSSNFTPNTPMPVTESLLPSLAKNGDNNPAAQLLNSYKKVVNASSGKSFIPAHSLSTDSYPMSLKMMDKAIKEGIGNINFHGHNGLNTLGFPTQAAIPENTSLHEINSYINSINKNMSKKIPYAYIDNGRIQAPTLTITRKKYGGWLNKYK